MTTKDSLGDRMKIFESSFRQSLPPRMPIILRLDGCHFHSYTKQLKRPFDQRLIDVMDESVLFLCEQIQGCQMAFIQSDEVSLLLTNYQTFESQGWFGNEIQKMVSVSSALLSSKFTSLSHHLFKGETKIATFDSRAFILPKEEVVNMFTWRQQDATRNSIQMLARSLYSHSACDQKNQSDLQEMIFQKGQNWNDLPTHLKRGRCVVKVKKEKEIINQKTGEKKTVVRGKWTIDNEIPIFSQDRSFIQKFVDVEEKEK